MTSYYLIKIRKDLAKALPIVLLLLIFAYFGGKSAIEWNAANETWPPFPNTSSPKTTPPPLNESLPKPPVGIGCSLFQTQLDQQAQAAFKEGYLCAKQQKNCPVPEGLTLEEREQLEKNTNGFYFDAKYYVNQKSTTKDYYIHLMTASYACTNQNLELLKKFIYEQQWKTGILQQ